MHMKDKLKAIVAWLNRNYNQDSENYSIFTGSKPGVIKYDENTAISPWGCGAIVCIGSLLYFIGEDDGNWFLVEGKEDYVYGVQDLFSIGWAEGFAEAMKALVEYTKENGHPVYFSGTNILCHYSL